MKKIFYPMLILFLLVPLGLISENPAWAEWDNEYYQEVLGYIPEGIKNSFSIEALIPDYTFAGLNDIASYYISALLGIVLIFGFFYLVGKKVAR